MKRMKKLLILTAAALAFAPSACRTDAPDADTPEAISALELARTKQSAQKDLAAAVSPDAREKAYDQLYMLYAGRNMTSGLNETAVQAVADSGNSPEGKFKASLLIASMNGVPRDKEIHDLAMIFSQDGISAEKMHAVYLDLAKLFNCGRRYPEAREFLRKARELIPLPVHNSYICNYLTQPPPGAGGWIAAGHPQIFRDQRFFAFSARPSTDKAQADSVFAFGAAYDVRAIHFYVEMKPESELILALQPGVHAVGYYQLRFQNTDSCWTVESIGLPPLDQSDIQAHAITTQDGRTVAAVSFPWRIFYGATPFLSGGRWPLMIAFRTPEKPFSWGRLRTSVDTVSGTSDGLLLNGLDSWGYLLFEPATQEVSLTLMKSLMEQGEARFRSGAAALKKRGTKWVSEAGIAPFFASYQTMFQNWSGTLSSSGFEGVKHAFLTDYPRLTAAESALDAFCAAILYQQLNRETKQQ